MLSSPVYKGRRIMRGSGLGSIFASLFRSSVPYLKSAGRYAGRQLLEAGSSALSDIASGTNVKQAMKNTVKRTKSKILDDIKRKMRGGGLRKRMKNKSGGINKKKKTRKRKRRSSIKSKNKSKTKTLKKKNRGIKRKKKPKQGPRVIKKARRSIFD